LGIADRITAAATCSSHERMFAHLGAVFKVAASGPCPGFRSISNRCGSRVEADASAGSRAERKQSWSTPTARMPVQTLHPAAEAMPRSPTVNPANWGIRGPLRRQPCSAEFAVLLLRRGGQVRVLARPTAEIRPLRKPARVAEFLRNARASRSPAAGGTRRPRLAALPGARLRGCESAKPRL
jgi:hypothetical protein